MLKLNKVKFLKYLLELQALAEELFQAWMYERSKRWINRRWIVHPINKKRLILGYQATLFEELKKDSAKFFEFTRMDPQTFNYLLSMVKPYLEPHRKRRDSILSEPRLAITLRYLATGDQISSISFAYRIGKSTAYKIIKQCCKIIHQVLSSVYLRPPCIAVWRNISKGFEHTWNLPNCCGAVDGKHVAIQSPSDSGSLYFNYKKFHSVVLLAACNHRYEFTVVDVGAYGSDSDGGILARSEFGKALDEGHLNLPKEAAKLPNIDIKIPFYFVGDEAFRMTENMMRPYPGRHLSKEKRIFNYRLSRARRCIENAFGILVCRWRVLTKPIVFNPMDVDDIILACVCLHNFLMARTQKSVRQLYCPAEYTNDSMLSEVTNESSTATNVSLRQATQEAHNMRDILTKYLVSPEGQVPWQDEYINRGRNEDV